MTILFSLAFPILSWGKTITVSGDGSGDFTTIQKAVAAIPDNSDQPTLLHLKAGSYTGQIVLPRKKHHVTIEGDGTDKTFVNYSYNTNEQNPPEVSRQYWGVGFLVLSDDFVAHDVTFQNISGDHGQALALRIDGDREVVNRCRMLGWQDTLMVNGGRQYFRDDYIAGRVDFIYGSANAVFDHCEIHSKNGGHVTAASTPKDHKYGFTFLNSKLTGDAIPWDPATTNPSTTVKPRPTPKADLGRPWRPWAMVIYLRCEIGDHIQPYGWDNWGNEKNERTARYAEYKNTGPGGAGDQRVGWSHQLTDQQAADFTVSNILEGNDSWDPSLILTPQ